MFLSIRTDKAGKVDPFPDEVIGDRALIWVLRDICGNVVGSGHLIWNADCPLGLVRSADLDKRIRGKGFYAAILAQLSLHRTLESGDEADGRLSGSAKHVWVRLRAYKPPGNCGAFRIRRGSLSLPKLPAILLSNSIPA